MSEAPAIPTALRALLLASDEPALVTALALVERAGADPARAARLAELARDPELAPRRRATALLAVAIALAAEPASVAPDAALDAVEDADTIDAAIEAGLAAALTGVMRAAPREGSLQATRRMIGRRCLAAGVVGPHVARLLADAGDREGAAHAAVVDLAPRLDGDRLDRALAAWLHLLVSWSADAARPLFGDVVRALSVRPAAIEQLSELLQRLPGAAPERVAAARARILWEMSHTPDPTD